MYKGKRFTREQLLFVVQTIFNGATDQIQSCLPPSVPVEEVKADYNARLQYLKGIVNTVGIQLPIFYAQLNDDGMAAGEFVQFGDFNELFVKYMRAQLGMSDGFNEDGTFPDTNHLAEEFVNEYLTDYILGG